MRSFRGMHILLKRSGIWPRKVQNISFNQGGKTISTNTKTKIVISENNKEDWIDFANVSKREFYDDLVYKRLYPDPIKRSLFIDHLYEHLGRTGYLNGYGSLIRIKAQRTNTPDVNETIGGMNVVFGWNRKEQEKDMMKTIDPIGWQICKRRNKWIQENVHNRMDRAAVAFGTSAWYLTVVTLCKEYRPHVKGVETLLDGLEQLYEIKGLNRSTLPICFGYVVESEMVEFYSSKGIPLVQAMVCNEGKNFVESLPESARREYADYPSETIYIVVTGNPDDDKLKQLKELTYDEQCIKS